MKNLLFTGNPATGKTFLARAAAYYLCYEKLNIDSLQSKDIYKDWDKIEDFICSERCEFIQVHPSMTYEDIVYGIDIKATGTMTVDYVEKRIKKLCDRAGTTEELCAVIFDDISRVDAGALLGNLIYAMEFRNESVPLSDGSTLCIPDNVIIILTECRNFHAGHLDYALRRRMDYVAELKSDRDVLEKYYDTVNANAGRIIIDIFDSIKDFITTNAAPGIPDVADKYMFGHGMFMVERTGTAYFVLDKFKQKMMYQIFPFINNLSSLGILRGNIEVYEKALESKLNTGISSLNRISDIRKVMVNSGERVEPYSLEDTISYYETEIIANRCSDYKGLLESVIDAIVLNGVFPCDIATDSLLFNIEVASVPSKSVPVAYASYLVKMNDAPSFYYETAVKGKDRRNPHAYYSTRPGNVGRWAERTDVAAYEISYTDGSPSDTYLPLNGLRLHTFTVNNVCKDNNPAEIYGAVYRLLLYYLKLYEMNISLVKGHSKVYGDLNALIHLEIKYPFMILAERKANEDYGDCYGMSFVYSGGFLAEVELDQFNHTRMQMGLMSEHFSYQLLDGESLIAPEVMMSFSANGLSKLSHNFQKCIGEHICRGKYKNEIRPILVNSWEASYFDISKDSIIGLSKDAAELGVEMLVMDDGWFGKRDDDNSGLGDWVVNESKLGCTLAELVHEVNDQGIKFGIWIEPEMVNEDSDLYRKHPDWALVMPGRKPVRSRNQLVLDFSRREVVDYIFEQICNVIDTANIEYIKWDMNRSITSVYSHSSNYQGKVYYDYVIGVYDFLERLISKYPNILIEGCSGGGGRFDAGMLYYTPQIWCSDNTDAIDRTRIQYGTSFGYPVSTVGSHVSAVPNHQTGRTVSIDTRGVVAMSGTFGYELDFGKLSDADKAAIKNQVVEFKKNAKLIQNGLYYRLSNPFEDSYAAWEMISDNLEEVLVNIVMLETHGNMQPVFVRLKGLETGAMYEDAATKKVYPSEVLMHIGLPFMPEMGEYKSTQINLLRLN